MRMFDVFQKIVRTNNLPVQPAARAAVLFDMTSVSSALNVGFNVSLDTTGNSSRLPFPQTFISGPDWNWGALLEAPPELPPLSYRMTTVLSMDASENGELITCFILCGWEFQALVSVESGSLAFKFFDVGEPIMGSLVHPRSFAILPNHDPDAAASLEERFAKGVREVAERVASQILALNVSRDLFVVRREPLVQRGKKDRILTADARPLYIGVRRTDIHKYLNVEPQVVQLDSDEDLEADTAPRSSHLRRGHYVWLTHERYKRNPDGSVRCIWRKPCWVGPEEGVVGNKRYRVLLEFGKQE